METKPRRTILALSLTLAVFVVVSEGPASLADGLASPRARGPGDLAAANVETTCQHFFRGGSKLHKGGAETTADDLSILTKNMRVLDRYQQQASARILEYERQCWQLIKYNQLQNATLIRSLGSMGEAAIESKKAYSDAHERMTESTAALRHDLKSRRLRSLDQIRKASRCDRDLSQASEQLQRDFDRFQGLSATRLSHCGDPRSPKGTVEKIYSRHEEVGGKAKP